MLAIATTPKTSPLQNLAKLLTMAIHDKYKIVRVINHTANVTDGNVVIRRSVAIPDGVYNIEADGTLSCTKYQYGLGYPDLELIRPPFEKMTPFCELPTELLSFMIELCVEANRLNGLLILDSEKLYLLQNPALNIRYQFGIPQELRLTPKYLWIALVEMLQYPQVYLLKEISAGDKHGTTTPLVIGHDWGSCALILLKQGGWNTSLE